MPTMIADAAAGVISPVTRRAAGLQGNGGGGDQAIRFTAAGRRSHQAEEPARSSARGTRAPEPASPRN